MDSEGGKISSSSNGNSHHHHLDAISSPSSSSSSPLSSSSSPFSGKKIDFEFNTNLFNKFSPIASRIASSNGRHNFGASRPMSNGFTTHHAICSTSQQLLNIRQRLQQQQQQQQQNKSGQFGDSLSSSSSSSISENDNIASTIGRKRAFAEDENENDEDDDDDHDDNDNDDNRLATPIKNNRLNNGDNEDQDDKTVMARRFLSTASTSISHNFPSSPSSPLIFRNSRKNLLLSSPPLAPPRTPTTIGTNFDRFRASSSSPSSSSNGSMINGFHQRLFSPPQPQRAGTGCSMAIAMRQRLREQNAKNDLMQRLRGTFTAASKHFENGIIPEFRNGGDEHDVVTRYHHSHNHHNNNNNNHKNPNNNNNNCGNYFSEISNKAQSLSSVLPSSLDGPIVEEPAELANADAERDDDENSHKDDNGINHKWRDGPQIDQLDDDDDNDEDYDDVTQTVSSRVFEDPAYLESLINPTVSLNDEEYLSEDDDDGHVITDSRIEEIHDDDDDEPDEDQDDTSIIITNNHNDTSDLPQSDLRIEENECNAKLAEIDAQTAGNDNLISNDTSNNDSLQLSPTSSASASASDIERNESVKLATDSQRCLADNTTQVNNALAIKPISTSSIRRRRRSLVTIPKSKSVSKKLFSTSNIAAEASAGGRLLDSSEDSRSTANSADQDAILLTPRRSSRKIQLGRSGMSLVDYSNDNNNNNNDNMVVDVASTSINSGIASKKIVSFSKIEIGSTPAIADLHAASSPPLSPSSPATPLSPSSTLSSPQSYESEEPDNNNHLVTNDTKQIITKQIGAKIVDSDEKKQRSTPKVAGGEKWLSRLLSLAEVAEVEQAAKRTERSSSSQNDDDDDRDDSKGENARSIGSEDHTCENNNNNNPRLLAQDLATKTNNNNNNNNDNNNDNDNDNNRNRFVRRSARNRIRPLNYWQGERALYRPDKLDDSDVPISTLVGVSPVSREPIKMRKNFTRSSSSHHSASPTSSSSSSSTSSPSSASSKNSRRNSRRHSPPPTDRELKMANILNLSIHNKKLLRSQQRMKALNADEKEDQEFILSFAKVDFRESKNSPGIYTAITNKVSNIAFGKLKFEMKAEKKRTKTGNYVTHFNVVYGSLLLRVEGKAETIIKSGFYFHVGKQETYAITNLRNDEAMIDFTIIKDHE